MARDETDEITWEDPPGQPRIGAPRKWENRLAPLREHPGKWANLGRARRQIVSTLNRGLVVGVDEGDFEATGRDYDRTTGEVTLYVRYVGKEPTDG